MDWLFTLANLIVLPFWVLMVVAPRWRLTRNLMIALWPVLLVPLLYTILICPHLPTFISALIQPSLSQVAELLGTPEGALLAWLHFLALDLFVGRWAYLGGLRRDMNIWSLRLSLLLILFLGPLGLLTTVILGSVERLFRSRS